MEAIETNSGEHEIDIPIEIGEPIDATDLIIGQIIVDDENYDEVIVLDLRRREHHDAWLV